MKRNIDPAIKEEYMNWLLTPPGEREPSTKKEFAEEHNVSYRTLYYWEDEDDFQSALRELKAKWGTRWHGDILGRLMDIVQNGSDNAAVSASKVLLAHLRIPDDENDQLDNVGEDVKRAIRKALEEEGFSVINE